LIYLILCILINAGLILVFRIFPALGIKSFQAITANYFVAGALGFFLSQSHPFHRETLYQEWFPYVLVLGIMFISLFYLIALTTQKLGVSIASVSNKMSVVIPVIFASILYHEKLSLIQYLGLAGALTAVVLVSIKKENQSQRSKEGIAKLLPVILFLGCGMLDTLVNYLQFRYVSNLLPSSFLLSSGFLLAGIIGLLIFSSRVLSKKDTPHPTSILAGFLLGIPNFFSMFLVMKTLESGIMNASVFFPVNNIGVVSAATIVSVVVFKEKLSTLNLAGIVLSLVSIYFIAFG
jgi:drug/metabolite transporter (DMT)-like permease